MSGLNFTLGGKIDPSFKASLNQAAAEAQAAGLRIQNSLRSQIGGIDKRLSKIDPMYSDYEPLMQKKASLQKNLLMVQNAQFLAAAKGRIAALESESDVIKYNAQLSGGAVPGGSPQSSGDWKGRMAAFKAMPGAAAEISRDAEKAAANIGKMAQNAGGLNLIIRETLVVFREIGRGNWTRIPGSLSLIAQGFSTLKGISLATLGAWGFAIGGLIGSVFIYLHRVKKLAGELQTSIATAFKPEHLAQYLSKLEILNQLHKDMADSARQVREAHDSVGESIERELDLTRDRISFERELLEAQKANALAAAKNPAEREAIEKKYSTLILANKKKERDSEFKALQEEITKLPGEIKSKEDEIKRLTSGDYVTKGRDDQILRKRQADADSAAKLAENDPALISKLQAKKTYYDSHRAAIAASGAGAAYDFTDTDQAKLEAAQTRMKNADSAQKSLNKWIDSQDDRERARLRVEELKKKVQEDSDRLAKLGPRGGGLVEDTLKKNLQKDKEDLALEQERLKRADAGRPLSGREVTERERVGFGSPQIALLDVSRSMDRKLGILVQHAQHSKATGGPGNFEDSNNW